MIRAANWSVRALVVAGMCMLIQGATEASAYADATCTVYDIKATRNPAAKAAPGKPVIKGKLPPKLVKKLARGAFTQWNTFELMKPHAKVLKRMTPVTIGIAPGKAILMLRNVTRDAGKKARVSLRVELQTKKGKQLQEMNTSLDVGDSLLVVDDGLRVRGGKYIFALRCNGK